MSYVGILKVAGLSLLLLINKCKTTDEEHPFTKGLHQITIGNPVYEVKDSSISFLLENEKFLEGISLGGELKIRCNNDYHRWSVYFFSTKKWILKNNHSIKLDLLHDPDTRFASFDSTGQIVTKSDIVHDIFMQKDVLHLSLRLISGDILVMDSLCAHPAEIDPGYAEWRNGKRVLYPLKKICVTK
jgi:hypothetical protein